MYMPSGVTGYVWLCRAIRKHAKSKCWQWFSLSVNRRAIQVFTVMYLASHSINNAHELQSV